MKKRKTAVYSNDFISEEDFIEQLGRVPNSPESDSPGDSEFDAGSEFLMGLAYVPHKRNPTSGRVRDINISLPESARTVSSDRPDPWQDLDTDSSTH